MGWARRQVRHLPMIIIAIGAMIGVFALGDVISFERLQENRTALLALREAHYGVLVAGFVASYVVIVAFSLPGAAVASVTGGFLFGLWAGTVFNVAAASLGAAGIFLAARSGLGSVLAQRMEASGGMSERIAQRLREHEISVLLMLRLVPVVPFFLANLLPALVGVSFRNFLWTTALGIIPGAFVFTSVGVGLGEVFDRGDEPDLTLLWSPQVIGPLLALAALAGMPMILRALRKREP